MWGGVESWVSGQKSPRGCLEFIYGLEGVFILFIVFDFVTALFVFIVKTLRRQHLGRALGRMSGTKGKTKFTIENATRTRVVIENKCVRAAFFMNHFIKLSTKRFL